MDRKLKAGAAPLLGPPPPHLSSHDQLFEDRLRIAERLVQILREAGYSCGLGDDGHARALKRED